MSASDQHARCATLVDANLLVLLVVGRTGREIIDRHKRTKSRFVPEDYDTLLRVVSGDQLVTLPHVLTEASNLLGQTRDPDKTALRDTLGRMMDELDERWFAGVEAVRLPEFRRLGMTDAAIIRAAIVDRRAAGTTRVLTCDLDLHRALLERGGLSLNFNQWRPEGWA